MTKTTDRVIISCLRKLWLWSSERRQALARADNHCEECGQPKTKDRRLEVHHLEPVKFEILVRAVRRYLLVNPDALLVLCRECHRKLHGGKHSGIKRKNM